MNNNTNKKIGDLVKEGKNLNFRDTCKLASYLLDMEDSYRLFINENKEVIS